MTGPDLFAELQSSLGAAYSFDREIGGGGMARVFLAHERGLGRPVVIKILNPELAEGINADRFEREIKLAASLQQANIVPLLSAGRASQYAYYTMPFVEGRSLRDRLVRDSVLPIGEGVSLLRDVARALVTLVGAPRLDHVLYNVSSGTQWQKPILTWCEALRQAYPKFTYRTAGADDPPNIWYTDRDRGIMDVGRLEHATGVRMRYQMREAYDDYLGWLSRTPRFLRQV